VTPTFYQQLQGLYTAGDVLCAVDVVRALPEYRHVVFVNHDEGWDSSVEETLYALGAEVRRAALVGEEDLDESLSAVLYHCVGRDDARRGTYVRFREEPPGVPLAAWLHTPGLCGSSARRYDYLGQRGCSRLLFSSTFSLHHTPLPDFRGQVTRAVVHPVAVDRYLGVTRVDDSVFRIGRWSRGHDCKYPDDFLALLASLDIPNVEFICMGIPSKLRGHELPDRVTFLENGTVSPQSLLARLDVLLFATDAHYWHEGWCRTVTEAMAAGVVPVVENRGGLVDQVVHGYNGFLCESNDDYRRYCRLLRDDPLLHARMVANGRAFAKENFGLEALRRDLLQAFQPVPPRRLNMGCGLDIMDGYVNFDTVPLPGVDLAAAVDPFYPRLPFADQEFDEILAFHVLERVANRGAIIEEVWRIARHNAVIKVKLPDRRHSDAFLDPTHLSFWEVDSIDFYLPGHLRSCYSPATFGLLAKGTTEREIYWELLALHHRRPQP
jgi:glycosyltransferase involved in cell wall biosynthesis